MKILSLFTLLSFFIVACGSNATTANDGSSVDTEQQDQPKVKNLSQSDLQAKIAEDNVVLIDVRTPAEIDAGIIKGADAFIDYNGPSFQEEIKKLDKSKTYVMYCRSGGRSGNAANFMVKNGFTNVYNLQGGILSYSGEVVNK